MLDRSTTRYAILLSACDVLLTLCVLSVSAWLRRVLPFGAALSEPGATITAGIYVAAAVIWPVCLSLASAYDARRLKEARDEAGRVFVGVSQATLVLAGFLYLTFRGLSRLLFVMFYVLDFFVLIGVRLALRVVFQHTGSPMPRQRVLVVGAGSIAAQVGSHLADLRWIGLELAGFVRGGDSEEPEERRKKKGEPAPAAAKPIVGDVSSIRDLVQTLTVSEVIIAARFSNRAELASIIDALVDLPVSVRVVPDFLELAFLRSNIEQLGRLPLVSLKEPVIGQSGRVLKRALDVVVALVVLVFLSPFMAAVAVLIRHETPGPAVYRSRRVGEGGREFWMYKFRTMVAGADQQQAEMMERNDQGQVVVRKEATDRRVTRWGRVLRRFSADELPQLINVLRGEMSLVGPRPELPEIVATYPPEHRRRLAVPPGMTGWWQVRDRSQTLIDLRIEEDMYYVQNYSIWLDLRILWETIGAVVSGKGAY